MKVIKWIVGIVVLLVAAFFVVGQFLPKTYAFERSIVVDADRAEVHELVSDLKAWPKWSPWIEEDPSIKTTLGEKTEGVGAHQSWTSDNGPGELTLTESSPESGVAYDMSFNEGQFKAEGAIRYASDGEGTRVTWSMNGDDGGTLVGRYFALMTDSMVGPMFERGLEKLKAAAEK